MCVSLAQVRHLSARILCVDRRAKKRWRQQNLAQIFSYKFTEVKTTQNDHDRRKGKIDLRQWILMKIIRKKNSNCRQFHACGQVRNVRWIISYCQRSPAKRCLPFIGWPFAAKLNDHASSIKCDLIASYTVRLMTEAIYSKRNLLLFQQSVDAHARKRLPSLTASTYLITSAFPLMWCWFALAVHCLVVF